MWVEQSMDAHVGSHRGHSQDLPIRESQERSTIEGKRKLTSVYLLP